MRRSALTVAASAVLLALPLSPAAAAELVVAVTGIQSATGEVGCALFPSAQGFPMERGSAVMQWQPAKPAGVTCRFEGLKAGTYAVAISHDLNGNRVTDTNFLGIPREDWGVSNDIRPTMRAPRFEEAAFRLADGPAARITIQVGR